MARQKRDDKLFLKQLMAKAMRRGRRGIGLSPQVADVAAEIGAEIAVEEIESVKGRLAEVIMIMRERHECLDSEQLEKLAYFVTAHYIDANGEIAIED
jgi:formylmethanofuran:tetrahydromethanopterin formyltransferase